jgi:histone acetyltransferase (RNA polymerase elongator complex component)
MESLLKAVKPYLREGLFTSIRVSTRPDAIDEKRLDLMKAYGVLTVELGAQSMDDDVLALSKRGHGALDTVRSVQLLRQQGLKVGIQLMPGLPGDSENKFMKTVDEVITLQPDVVRLYPAVVIKGTELAEWHKEKRYQPLGLEEAVNVCRESCIRLEANGIPVIRMGLMSSASLRQEGQIVAGPWHEAFGFLVRSAIYQKNVEPFLPDPNEAAKIILRVHFRDIPLARGYKNLGLRSIEDKTGAEVIKVMVDETVPSGQIGVDKI